MSRAWLVAAVLLAAGCPSPPPTPPCSGPFWGDPSGTPALEIGMRLDDGGFGEITTDDQPVDLTFPLQGGHVLFVGARIHNMRGCQDDLNAEVHDPATGHLEASERRLVSFIVPDDDGGITDLSDTTNVANVPMCPDYGTRDIVNTDWILQVTVTEFDGGRQATASHHVTPVCRQTDPRALALCQCECQANYFLGKCNPALDAGVDGGDAG